MKETRDRDRELTSGCKVKVVQVLSDRGRELKSIFKSNLGLNDNSGFKVIRIWS